MRKKQKVNWTNLIAKQKGTTKNYKTTDSFYVGEYIDHNSFGVGYIQSSFGNKIEVLFEDKMRVLIHMVMF